MKYLFEVHIKPGYTAEDYADAWVRASKIIQQAPGARGTRLHRKLDDPNCLIAIASWESKAQRDAMEGQHNERVAEIIRSAAPCCEIRPIGEFDEPEWVVLPPHMKPQGGHCFCVRRVHIDAGTTDVDIQGDAADIKGDVRPTNRKG